MNTAPIRNASRELENLDNLLNSAAKVSRDVIRTSKFAIAEAHKGASGEAYDDLEKATSSLMELVKDHPKLLNTGTVTSALQEYAEAMIVRSIAKGEDIPGHLDLGIPSAPYLLGVADSVGEVRRSMLNAIASDDLPEAERLFRTMEEVLGQLSAVSLAKEIVPIRRKVDVARAVVERSHGDLTYAIVTSRAVRQ